MSAHLKTRTRSSATSAPGSFHRDTIIKDGPIGFSVDCRLGLWGVSGSSFDVVMAEARHYYRQYHADGEYDRKEAGE